MTTEAPQTSLRSKTGAFRMDNAVQHAFPEDLIRNDAARSAKSCSSGSIIKLKLAGPHSKQGNVRNRTDVQGTFSPTGEMPHQHPEQYSKHLKRKRLYTAPEPFTLENGKRLWKEYVRALLK
jgi:hypothetical protein